MRCRETTSVVVLVAAISSCSIAGGEVGSAPSPPAGVQRGGVLRVGITPPGGISPLDAYEPVGRLISATMCDPLVAIDPVTGQVREALARGWVLTPDGGITIKLRHGLRFTNGSELKVTDVNYSLQQLVSPANGAYTAGLAKQFVAINLNAKQADVLADPDKAPDVAFGVNKYDLQVVTRTPDAGALRSFAEPAMAPISRTAHDADADAFRGNPVCVGPYVLDKPYRSGDTQIRLTRSKKYFGGNVGYTGGGKGYADSIVFTVYPTPAAALAAYRAGQVDVVQVPRDDVARTTDVASRVYGAATGVEYVGLPGASTGPFTDPEVRIALSQAIDRTKLVADVFGPASQVANGFEPPALAISKGKSLRGKTVTGAPLASCGDSTPLRPDLVKARAHLRAAAGRTGATPLKGFTLEVNDDAPYPAMARALAAQWKAGLGLNVRVVTTPWSSYVGKASGSSGFQNPFRIRWATNATAPGTTYNNEQTFLSSLFSGEATNVANWAHFNDRGFEFGLAEEAAGLTEVAQRGLAFAKLAGILCRDLPMIPLVFDRPTFLVRSTALGAARPVPVGRDGVLLLRELYLR